MSEVETKSVSLDTLAVTIQALHVNGKQMTLSVFRQLPEGIISEETLDWYNYWGIVRYGIGNAGTWAVADGDGVLYRLEVPKTNRGLTQGDIAAKKYVLGFPQLFIAV